MGTNIGLVPRDHADILDLLDNSLQQAGDLAYPEEVKRDGQCICDSCPNDAEVGSEMCDPCRSFLYDGLTYDERRTHEYNRLFGDAAPGFRGAADHGQLDNNWMFYDGHRLNWTHEPGVPPSSYHWYHFPTPETELGRCWLCERSFDASQLRPDGDPADQTSVLCTPCYTKMSWCDECFTMFPWPGAQYGHRCQPVTLMDLGLDDPTRLVDRRGCPLPPPPRKSFAGEAWHDSVHLHGMNLIVRRYLDAITGRHV